MAASPRNPNILTPNEAADLLLVSPITVRQWAQRGLLPFLTTPGGHRRFRRADVEDFARRRGSTSLEDLAGVRPTRILIVDDDPHFRSFASELIALAAPDVTVETAADGFEAGVKTQSFRPQIVLLDLRMPRMNGLEACRLLRSDPSLQDVRIIAISAHHDAELGRQIVEAGAEACLDKPIEAGRLLEVLGLR